MEHVFERLVDADMPEAAGGVVLAAVALNDLVWVKRIFGVRQTNRWRKDYLAGVDPFDEVR